MLKVRGLSVLHRPGQELHDISLTVGRGEAVVIIGANGSGKSLLLHAIAAQSPSYQGEVIVNHYKASTEPERFTSLIGVLLSPFQPPEHLTGFEFLELLGSHYRLSGRDVTERIITRAKDWQIHHRLYSLIETLSLAERQIIGLIGSTLADSPVLILDEPDIFLDPSNQRRVQDVIQTKKKNGDALLIATNNLALAQSVADHLVVLIDGHIVAEGTIAQLASLAQSSKDLPAAYHKLVDRHGYTHR